jgi:hypothetical protein
MTLKTADSIENFGNEIFFKINKNSNVNTPYIPRMDP